MKREDLLSCLSQPNQISLELAIATISDSSIDEISTALMQMPPEQRYQLAIAWVSAFGVEEMTEVLQQLPIEKTGDMGIAIGRVWQQASE